MTRPSRKRGPVKWEGIMAGHWFPLGSQKRKYGTQRRWNSVQAR